MSVTLDFKKYTGEVRLSSAHAVVMPHRPYKVKLEDIQKQLKESSNSDIISFGLFETSSPNYTTYYPDVTAEDFKPKDEDFINPVFRLLSETIVAKYRPIDFSKPGVLKASMKMLLGQSVNIDHETAVGNAIGSVSEVYWQESYKTSSGIVVPAGINGTLKIDAKSNPRIARGIMMEPPSIHSNSVTIRFKWEPSHKFENENEFYQKVGSYDKKGELIRCIVTDIKSYSETSLVGHGADTFAQKVNDKGEIVNPRYATQNKSFNAEQAYINTLINIDYKTNNDMIGLSLTADPERSIPENLNNNHNNTSEMDELIENLTSEFGFESDELTADNLVEKLKAKIKPETEGADEDLTQEVEDLNTQLKDKEKDIKVLKAELKTLKDNSQNAETILTNTRKEAVRLYKLCKGDNAEESVVNLLNSAEVETVSSFLRQYQQEADEKFGLTCNDCQSTNVSRLSAKTTKDGIVTEENAGENGGNKTPKSNSELLSTFKSKKKTQSRIFSKIGNKDSEDK